MTIRFTTTMILGLVFTLGTHVAILVAADLASKIGGAL